MNDKDNKRTLNETDSEYFISFIGSGNDFEYNGPAVCMTINTVYFRRGKNTVLVSREGIDLNGLLTLLSREEMRKGREEQE
jgi:hypothetical protein